ncbi:MAG: hypothetical protein FWF87_00925 [Synergistaceae bacterium]|nr:hypothetical protein [Synergistaceae bacterium]
MNKLNWAPDDITRAMGGKLTQEQQALLKKFDKESSTRTLENHFISRLFYWGCVAVALYRFDTSYFWPSVMGAITAEILSIPYVCYWRCYSRGIDNVPADCSEI